MSHCAAARWMRYICEVETAFVEAVAEVKAVAMPGELRPDDNGCRVGLQMLDRVLIDRMLVGEITNGKDENYQFFSNEKAVRVLEKYVERGDVSSFQSADFDAKKFPGAIIALDANKRPHAYTCSAYPWKFDEAICLLTAYKVGNLTKLQAIAIANISSNEIFMRVAATLPDVAA